jgi:PhnB protein
MPAKPIPDGYEGATPYLCCKDAASALEFYKTELMRMPMPDGKIGHAEIQIGGARIMLSDELRIDLLPCVGAATSSGLSGSLGFSLFAANASARNEARALRRAQLVL